MGSETAFQIAFWTLLGLVMIMRVFFAAQVRKSGGRLLPDGAAVEREGRAAFAVRFVGFFALIGILVAYGLKLPWMQALSLPLPAWLRWTGFSLGLLSLGLWTWTQRALGAQWSAQLQLRQDHRLITTGPYARVRHPLYAGMIGWATGLALVTANGVFVALAVLTSSVLIARVPREERMMIERFGDEYRAYMSRTGRFLPH